jgi:hypothetical protein
MDPEVIQVPQPAFAFCRISLTALLWAALVFHQTWLVGLAFVILALSALFKVHRSPLVVLYSITVLKVWPTQRYAFLDVAAMRFAHGMGAVFALIAFGTLLQWPDAGWYVLLGFCLLKTVSAFGLCPASKLFVCLRKGGCCALSRSRC